MKRTLVVVAAGLVLSFLLPHDALAFGVKDVVTMSRDGVPDSLIIAKIRHGDTRFDLDAKDFHVLKEAGVSNDVVLAMLRTEDSGHAGVYRDSYYWWPYYSPWSWDFDFDFYAPYYHTVHVRPGFGYHGFAGSGHGSRRR